jgi:hypothetical protein
MANSIINAGTGTRVIELYIREDEMQEMLSVWLEYSRAIRVKPEHIEIINFAITMPITVIAHYDDTVDNSTECLI